MQGLQKAYIWQIQRMDYYSFSYIVHIYVQPLLEIFNHICTNAHMFWYVALTLYHFCQSVFANFLQEHEDNDSTSFFSWREYVYEMAEFLFSACHQSDYS